MVAHIVRSYDTAVAHIVRSDATAIAYIVRSYATAIAHIVRSYMGLAGFCRSARCARCELPKRYFFFGM